MLPFLAPKKMVSVIVSQRGKNDLHDVNSEVEAPGSDMDPGLQEAAEDMLRAIDTRSPMDLAKALKAAFEICDSYEDEEGENLEQENE